MNKKIPIYVVLLLISTLLFAQASQNKKKFVKGNLSDKTSAVLNASPAEISELSMEAIKFCLQNKQILRDDRELSALVTAGILSLPDDYTEHFSEKEKSELSAIFFNLYTDFSDDTVKIAVLNKMASLKLKNEELIIKLNDYLKSSSAQLKTDLSRTAIIFLGYFGKSRSFSTLYELYKSQKWDSYKETIAISLGLLAQSSIHDVIIKIQSANDLELRLIFELFSKNEKNSTVLRAETAENILSRTIYIAGNVASVEKDLVSIQMDSYKMLADLKWTRSSKIIMSFFTCAAKEYEAKAMTANDFTDVISRLPEIAPIDSVKPMSAYLSSVNASNEAEFKPETEPIVISLINSLGAIGDKNAFDSILSVINNYNYPENVIAKAREALAKLKWK